ncbi:MAG: non-hydrolyzing UDP-N-acetylglucosamine 2-epimerase [Gaiellaceae bacterium]
MSPRAGASERPTDVLLVVGARPNFMKAGPVAAAARAAGLSCRMVHTGQHYDDELSRIFFEELELPAPDVHLGVGSGSHAEQTARIMLGFESELLRLRPSVVMVVGDVNSTLACGLVAAKEHFPVAHVEAGLRSFDPRMPEELNRRLTDHLSSLLYTTSRDGDENLLREGIPADRIVFVGNPMIDTLLRFRGPASRRNVIARLGLADNGYALVTLHRPENVDDPETLRLLVGALREVSRRLPVVLPLHPRTAARLRSLDLDRAIADDPGFVVTEPLGYLDFTGLMAKARVVLTDSGGVQEETTVLGVPCLTLRTSTERPVTVSHGTNRVVGTDPTRVLAETLAILDGKATSAARIPELWDGGAGERIVHHLQTWIHDGLASTGTTHG